MKIIADLHIHGKYSRGCSKDLDLPNLEKWAKIKGVTLLGTGDFTHPLWYKHICENLKEENGILKSKTNFNFILQTEISLIYTQDGKGRKVHLVVLCPGLEVADQVREALLKRGRLDYDGRPIFGMSCIEFTEMLKGISNDIEIIPAHAWTPYFGVFGSMSGFNSMQEAFGDQTKHIYAMETGISSDPAMNWRISDLDKYLMVSFSDCHSFWPWRLGREATVVNCDLDYRSIIKAIRTREGFMETIECPPEYGKYHFDGHRSCDIYASPAETRKMNNKCPKCNKQLTLGVLHRVEALADREDGFKPANAQRFRTIIPLSEILSISLGKGMETKTVWEHYNRLIGMFQNEFNVLLNAPYKALLELSNQKTAELVTKMRTNGLQISPGYDGVYGELLLEEKEELRKQKELSQYFY